jgi:hypothetical protein
MAALLSWLAALARRGLLVLAAIAAGIIVGICLRTPGVHE